MRIIAGTLGGRSLKTVEGEGYRPAMGRIREAVFSMLVSRGLVFAEAPVLDLFAGSGSLAFEALSRGAPRAVLVERSTTALRCLEGNVAALGLTERTRLVREDVARFLRHPAKERFGLVFLDPPYGKNLAASSLAALARGWLRENALVVAETEKTLPAPVCEGLAPLAERLFGHTRINIWICS